ncbi:MAG: indole-3-glycerol phosphate synthase [Chloroflexota bacterium]|nr:indole-3-glycerol phosphate synthase [Chloroflexota bacterium]
MTILDEIKAHKVQEVAAREAARPLPELFRAVGEAPAVVRMRDALRQPGTQLIAEVKRRSPAKGSLRLDADAPALAATYFDAGAAAVSVLTDEKFFSGADRDLEEVRTRTRGPLLRKDFTISNYQVYEARSLGADAVLIIMSMLSDDAVAAFLDTVDRLGMDAILEVHNADEVRRAVATRAPIIGINNRDLSNFTVDLGTTERLVPLIPDSTVVISESGISTRADVERVTAAGAKAVLVGEALVTSGDPAAKVRELLGRS